MKNYNDHKVHYYENGNIKSKYYYLNYLLHRTDGPAIIFYNKDGVILEIDYCLNGNLHRTNGPARIYYDKSGNVEEEYYYLNGELIKVHSLKEFEKYVKTLILK